MDFQVSDASKNASLEDAASNKISPKRVYVNPWGREAEIGIIVNQEKSRILGNVLNNQMPLSWVLESELKSLQDFCIRHEGYGSNAVFSRVLTDIVLVITKSPPLKLCKDPLRQVLSVIDPNLLTDFSKKQIQGYLNEAYTEMGNEWAQRFLGA